MTVPTAVSRGPVFMFAERVFGRSPSVPLSRQAVDEERAEAAKAEAWDLVRAAQDGDSSAFGRLYDRYVDTVFRFVYFRVNDRALAEDFARTLHEEIDFRLESDHMDRMRRILA